jgi:hypothetical protein
MHNIVICPITVSEYLVYPKDREDFTKYVVLKHIKADKNCWETYRRKSSTKVELVYTSSDLGMCFAHISLECER